VSQLVLGTAQFGHGYGITNQRGRMTDAEIAEILDLALESGISRIDTAAVYGDAPKRLRPWASSFTFTGKIVATDPIDPIEQISASLDVLGCEKFEACLMREWDRLDERARERVIERMITAQGSGLIKRIGVAAYTREDVISFRKHLRLAGQDVGAIQVPANPVDQRLDDDQHLKALCHRGTEVAVRSVFLQGLLLRRDQARFTDHPDLRRYWSYVNGQSSLAIRVCLGHVKALPWVSQVVVGVTSPAEWSEIITAWSEVTPELLPSSLASDDPNLLDPRLWPR
jgi:aryl-alcohol dehydrogenase-like predicted oxidoreductase